MGDQDFFAQLQNAQREILGRTEPAAEVEEPSIVTYLPNSVRMNVNEAMSTAQSTGDEGEGGGIANTGRSAGHDDAPGNGEPYSRLFDILKREPIFTKKNRGDSDADDAGRGKEDGERQKFLLRLIEYTLNTKAECRELFKDTKISDMNLKDIYRFLSYLQQAYTLMEMDDRSQLTLSITRNIVQQFLTTVSNIQPKTSALVRSLMPTVEKTYESAKRTDYQISGLLNLIRTTDPEIEVQEVDNMTRSYNFLKDLSLPCLLTSLAEVSASLIEQATCTHDDNDNNGEPMKKRAKIGKDE